MAKAKQDASKAPADKPEPRTVFTQGVADAICARIANGESLRSICALEGMPDKATVFRWLAEDDEFATKYARAREAQAEHHHDEMDRLEEATESGALNPQAASVILANKRWRMEKLKPKVYGAKVQTEHSGSIGVRSEREMTDAELEERIRRGESGG